MKHHHMVIKLRVTNFLHPFQFEKMTLRCEVIEMLHHSELVPRIAAV